VREGAKNAKEFQCLLAISNIFQHLVALNRRHFTLLERLYIVGAFAEGPDLYILFFGALKVDSVPSLKSLLFGTASSFAT
jgi:hypothetical protein